MLALKVSYPQAHHPQPHFVHALLTRRLTTIQCYTKVEQKPLLMTSQCSVGKLSE